METATVECPRCGGCGEMSCGEDDGGTQLSEDCRLCNGSGETSAVDAAAEAPEPIEAEPTVRIERETNAELVWGKAS